MFDKVTRILINPNYVPVVQPLDQDFSEPIELQGRVDAKRGRIDTFLSNIASIFKKATGQSDIEKVERKIHSELSNLTRDKFSKLTPQQQKTFCKNLKILHKNFGEKSTLHLEIRMYEDQMNQERKIRETRFDEVFKSFNKGFKCDLKTVIYPLRLQFVEGNIREEEIEARVKGLLGDLRIKESCFNTLFESFVDIYAFNKKNIHDLNMLVEPLKKELLDKFVAGDIQEEAVGARVKDFFNDFRLTGLKQKFGEVVVRTALSNLSIEGFISQQDFQKLIAECLKVPDQQKEIAFIKEYVCAFLKPYIAGQVDEKKAENRMPMIVDLQVELKRLGMNHLTKERIEEVALKEYVYQAALGNYMRQNAEDFSFIQKEQIKEFIQILTEAVKKDFPFLRQPKSTVKKLAHNALNAVKEETNFHKRQTAQEMEKYALSADVDATRHEKHQRLQNSGRLFLV